MPLRTLQIFAQYLHETENWAYRLIRAMPDTHNTIASKYFLKCNYYDPAFRCVQFPFQTMDMPRRGVMDRAVNWALSRTLSLYPRYLEQHLSDIDIIHSHFAYVGWEYRRLFKRRLIPHVVSFYGADYRLAPWGPGDPQDYFKWFDLLLCEGQHGARELINLGCPENKVAVQHLGVDVDAIDFHARAKSPGRLNLLQVATFREKKGQKYTLEAFLLALRDCPDMTLTFVGGDPEGLRRPIIEMATSLAKDKVTFMDAIPFSQLHGFMHNYHVFIHPSCHASDGNCEGGAPVVLLDAQATGMPVIATRHCDIPEEVIDGNTGLLASEKDTTGLAAAISHFCKMDQTEFTRFSRNAVDHIAEFYDAKKNACALKNLYMSCTKRTSSQAFGSSQH